MGEPAVRIEGLRFRYGEGRFALRVEDLRIEAGSKLACIGPSGSGKTTLVHLFAGILPPEAGRVWLGDVCLTGLSEDERRAHRIRSIGLVFQELELLDYLSAFENVLLPYHVTRHLSLDGAVVARARRLADAMGIGHVLPRPPRQLSQGERQRVAICRALVTEPQLVLCDEPTANLDAETAGVTLDLLFEQVERLAGTLLMVTHDPGTLGRFDGVVDMRELQMRELAR